MKLTEQEIIKLRKILFELFEISEEKWEQLLILLDSDGENFGGQEIRFVTEIGIPLVSSWEKRNQAYIQAYNKRGVWSDMPQPFKIIEHEDLILCIKEWIILLENWFILCNSIDEVKENHNKINNNV